MKRLLNSVGKSFRAFSDPHTVAYAAMLIALNVIITRFLSIQTQFLRIGFGFLPVAVFSMLFGPLPGAIAAAIGDLIGFFLFPAGPFFPGITFSAFVLGLIFGLFLYKRKPTLARVIAACFAAVFTVDLCLNTVWLSVMYDQAIELIIIPRLIKFAVMVPVEVILIFLFYRYLGARLSAEIGRYHKHES